MILSINFFFIKITDSAAAEVAEALRSRQEKLMRQKFIYTHTNMYFDDPEGINGVKPAFSSSSF